MSTAFSIPTGLRPPAQGCRACEATLGNVSQFFLQPQRGCGIPSRANGLNPDGVDDSSGRFPRVARASQPWADGPYPVGVNRTARSREIPLPPLAEQRRIVTELDAEAAQMESVPALLPRFEAKIQRVLARVWGSGQETAP